MPKMIVLSHDEILMELPYAVICEAHESASWNSTHRRREWFDSFTEEEKRASKRIFHQAHQWYLVSGAPDSIRMTGKTLELWKKLGMFCACCVGRY